MLGIIDHKTNSNSYWPPSNRKGKKLTVQYSNFFPSPFVWVRTVTHLTENSRNELRQGSLCPTIKLIPFHSSQLMLHMPSSDGCGASDVVKRHALS